jgi:hypothetical protein
MSTCPTCGSGNPKEHHARAESAVYGLAKAWARIAELEAALRELHAQVAQELEIYDEKGSPSMQAAMVVAEATLASKATP